MQQKELKPEEKKYLQSVVARDINQIDYLMEESAKALSLLTNYTTFVSEPVGQRTRIKQIRLLPFDSSSVLLIICLLYTSQPKEQSWSCRFFLVLSMDYAAVRQLV